MLRDVIEPGFQRMGDLLERWADDRPLEDAQLTMMLLLGGLVNLRRNLWTFGRVPLDASDDAAISAWVDIAVTVITKLGQRRDEQR